MSDRLATSPITEEVVSSASAERGFTTAMIISGIRCTLTYVLLPFVAPLIGFTTLGPVLGLAVGVVAIVSNVIGIRRFERSDHRWKRPAIAIHVGVTALVVALMVADLRLLLG